MNRIKLNDLTHVNFEWEGEKLSIPVTEKNLAMCDSDYENAREFWVGFKDKDVQVVICSENKYEDDEILKTEGSYVNVYENGGNEIIGEADIADLS